MAICWTTYRYRSCQCYGRSYWLALPIAFPPKGVMASRDRSGALCLVLLLPQELQRQVPENRCSSISAFLHFLGQEGFLLSVAAAPVGQREVPEQVESSLGLPAGLAWAEASDRISWATLLLFPSARRSFPLHTLIN